VSTKATDNDGLPLYEWKLDSGLGEISHIKRIPLINPKEISKSEPTTQAVEASPQAAPAPNKAKVVDYPAPVDAVYKQEEPQVGYTVEQAKPVEEPKFDDLDAQRDLAFKIVYAFIMFIIATFGLLYAYYKMDKKEQQQQARENRAKGAIYGKESDRTFFDFLAGHVDEEANSKHNAARSLPPQALH